MNEQIVVLTIKSQLTSGEKTIRLDKKRVVFGSSTSSDVCLQDKLVSPIHAILEVSGIDNKPVIYDLASDSGLKVNGKTTIQATLEKTDSFQIGPYLIQVRVQRFSEMPAKPQFVKESFGQKLFINEKEDLAPLIAGDAAQLTDIFDHRPESKQSLQVVMFYKDTILEVEHFVDKKRIVIGPGSREDFAIPPFLGKGKEGRFELVTSANGQYSLHLHDQMRGVISQNGKIRPLHDVMAATKTCPLMDKDFAKVTFNDVSFFMSFSPAPPKLKIPKIFDRDPTFMKIWMLSLALTGLIIGAMGTMTVNPTIEVEQLPERVATIIYEPKLLPIEKPPVPKEPEVKVVPVKVPPKPKKIKLTVEPKKVTQPAPKNAMIGEEQKKQTKAAKTAAPKKAVVGKAHQASGQEGAGAKAKGAEGSRGKLNASRTGAPQTKATRPGEGKKTDAAATNKGHSQTHEMGVVDVFKSNQGTLSKLLAGGSGAASAAKKLEGYSGFTTKGEGGLGAAGSATGGGGNSMGLGGLANSGAGGGKKGTGLGALGSGGNMLGGSGKVNIEGGGTPEPVILGNIDRDAIAREINKHRDEFKYCYEKEINAERPDLAGRVGVQFVIGASGTVSSAGISSTSLHNANTERCITEVMKRIQFPPIPGGGIAEVTYPFVFKPSTK